jgi:hypothetical protein
MKSSEPGTKGNLMTNFARIEPKGGVTSLRCFEPRSPGACGSLRRRKKRWKSRMATPRRARIMMFVMGDGARDSMRRERWARPEWATARLDSVCARWRSDKLQLKAKETRTW